MQALVCFVFLFFRIKLKGFFQVSPAISGLYLLIKLKELSPNIARLISGLYLRTKLKELSPKITLRFQVISLQQSISIIEY